MSETEKPAWDLPELMLHQRPLLLLDRVLEATDETCRARMVVDPKAWYADADGSMPGWFGIELMVQTVSAFSGTQKQTHGLPLRIGFNLGTRSYECTLPRFPAGAVLDVEIALRYLDESGLSAFACEIRHLGETVARAIVKTFEPA